MQLIKNWKSVLGGAWSVWLMAAAVLVSVADMLLRDAPDALPWLPVDWLPLVSATLAALAIPARIILQTNMSQWLARWWADEGGAVRRRTVGIIAGSAIAISTATAFIGGWEGLRTQAYRDIVGVWTVCYGETAGVRAGDSHSVSDCNTMLAGQIVAYEARLDKCLTAPVPIGMKIALVSWVYNVGADAACRSTLVRLANAGDLRGACNQLPRWNRAGGQVIRGLTNRRMSERSMCLRALDDAT